MRSVTNIFFLFLLIFGPPAALAEQAGGPYAPQRQELFRIERSTNSNIVQYDAQVTQDGRLWSEEPIVAYWVRHNEDGQVKELSWFQKRFAYGFRAQHDPQTDRVTLDMKAKIGRPVIVEPVGERYTATMTIDGESAEIERIFIQATGRGISTRVEFIELYGRDSATGEARYEKLIP